MYVWFHVTVSSIKSGARLGQHLLGATMKNQWNKSKSILIKMFMGLRMTVPKTIEQGCSMQHEKEGAV